MKEPEKTLFVDLGSNATFRWECNFGSEEDWTNFEQVFWGAETDNYGNIGNKFLTVDSKENVWSNPKVPGSVISRAVWSGTLSRERCQLDFLLKNAIYTDDGTYGCIGVVYGETFKSSPIRLIVLGKCKQNILSQELTYYSQLNFGTSTHSYYLESPQGAGV